MMKRLSDEQINSILHEAEAGFSALELCRKHAIYDAIVYSWRKKYGCMEVPEGKRLKSLEEENISCLPELCLIRRYFRWLRGKSIDNRPHAGSR